jgi:hypothetical protein
MIIVPVLLLLVIYVSVWVTSYGIAKHKVDTASPYPGCNSSYGGDLKICGYSIQHNSLGFPKAEPVYQLCCFLK